MTTLDQLQLDSWQVSEAHGFHAAQLALEPQTLATYLKLFLIVGELAEAGEELRAGHKPADVYYTYDLTGEQGGSGKVISDKPYMVIKGVQPIWFDDLAPALGQAMEIYGAEMGSKNVLFGKPEGFGIELADALIRLADLAEDVNISLDQMKHIKESYNKTREFMHGKTA
jgi:hypothetical protein